MRWRGVLLHTASCYYVLHTHCGGGGGGGYAMKAGRGWGDAALSLSRSLVPNHGWW